MRWGKKRKEKVAPAGLKPKQYQALAALAMEPRGHTGTKPPQFSSYIHGGTECLSLAPSSSSLKAIGYIYTVELVLTAT